MAIYLALSIIVAAVLLFVMLAPRDIAAAAPAWDAALVYLPDEGAIGTLSDPSVSMRLADRPAGAVVLYLHGCAGLLDHNRVDATYLARGGFIVVQPDSMARPGRKANCDPETNRYGMFPDAAEFRRQEIAYVADRLQSVSWADPGRLLLFGQSEGGFAAARYSGTAFRAIVVQGWDCSSVGPHQRGIAAPDSIPVLNVQSPRDPIYRSGRTCAGYLDDRPGSRVVGGDAPLHWMGDQQHLQETVLSFLRNAIQPRSNHDP